MLLFSKRFSNSDIELEKDNKFLKETTRNRLQQSIEDIVKSDEILEEFLLFKDNKNGIIRIHEKTFKELSLRELGYNMTQEFSCENSEFIGEYEYDDVDGESHFHYINDFYIFDFLELLLIFSKKEKIEDIRNIFQGVLDEECVGFTINGHLISNNTKEGLLGVVSLIKDITLKNKISNYILIEQENKDYSTLAKLSADILQFIFSSPASQKDTKKYCDNILDDISTNLVEKTKIQELKTILNDTIKHQKSLNNIIGDIRHTDQHKIYIKTPDLYKMIAINGFAIAEFIILSKPDLFIYDEDSETIKNNYLKKYNIDKNNGWIPKRQTKEDDLPF